MEAMVSIPLFRPNELASWDGTSVGSLQDPVPSPGRQLCYFLSGCVSIKWKEMGPF